MGYILLAFHKIMLTAAYTDVLLISVWVSKASKQFLFGKENI